MRKLIVSALLLSAGIYGFAQLKVASIEKVTLPEGVTINTATMSPDGSYIAITQNEKGGIHKLDLSTKSITTISETGHGYGLTISNDGQQVIFRENTIGTDHLRRTALKSANIATGRTSTLIKATRDLQGVAINDNAIMTINKGQLSTKALSTGAKAVATPVASIDKGRLMVTVNGKTTNISPQGSECKSYLWPSVSPDGTRVCYYLSGVGCYVCNLDGSNPVYLGKVRAAQWYDNATVVGMNDQDNGEIVTSSKIVAAKADGTSGQNLTEDASMAMYPTVSLDGSRISYSTPAGELYIINIAK